MKTKVEVIRTIIGTNNTENPRYMIAIHEGRRTWYLKSYDLKTYKYILSGDKLYGRPWSMTTVKKILKAENVSKYTLTE